MKGFGRFQKAMLEAAQLHIKPAFENHREALAETLKNDLFDLDGPRQLNRPLDSRDQFLGNAFRGFLEISKSVDTLNDIAFYMNRFPFKGTRITQERYLQFHVESYFSEIYILRERLKRFITLLNRQYKRDPRLSNVQERCQAITNMITNSLEGVIDVRRRHVHEFRFSDASIERLSTISILAQGPDDQISRLMKAYYQEEYHKVRKLWCNRTKENNKAVSKLLDTFFESVFSVVFEESSAVLRYPHGART